MKCLLLLAAWHAADVLAQNADAAAAPDPQQILETLDQLLVDAQQDITALDRHSDLWESLDAQTQAQIRALEAAQEAHVWEQFAGSEEAARDAWIGESGALMSAAAAGDPGGATQVAPPVTPEQFYEPQLQALTAQRDAIGIDLSQAQRDVKMFTANLSAYREGQGWLDYLPGTSRREKFLMASLATATASLATLSERYSTVSTQIDTLTNEAESIRRAHEHAAIRRNAAQLLVEQEKRLQAALRASQAVQQQSAEILVGQHAFDEVRETLADRVADARGDGRDSSADQWEAEIAQMDALEEGWLKIQSSRLATLQQNLNSLLANNARDSIGPVSGLELSSTLVSRGIVATLDQDRLAASEQQVSEFATGLSNNRLDQLTWRDFLYAYAESYEEVAVSSWDLVYDPEGAAERAQRFGSRYGSFWYGVGQAAKDGVVDLAVIGVEGVDLALESVQYDFNYVFGTDLDWAGDENLQFMAGVSANLSSEQLASLTDDALTAIDRIVAQNAALGEEGILNALRDAGYVVGTVAGAEELAVRAVVAVTKSGRILIKGRRLTDAMGDVASVGPIVADAVRAAPLPAGPRLPSPDELVSELVGELDLRSYTPPGGSAADTVYFVRFGDEEPFSLTHRLGGGSTTSAYLSPKDPTGRTVIKITAPHEAAGIKLDNYGYRLLETADIDATALHVPQVFSQTPIRGSMDNGVVTVVERGGTSARDLMRLTDNLRLTDGQLQAYTVGVEQLIKNRIIWPDGKLDNFGFLHLGGDNWRMSILDAGTMMLARDAKTAADFYRFVNAPTEAIERFLELPSAFFSGKVDEVFRSLGEIPRASTIADTKQILQDAIDGKVDYFYKRIANDPLFPDTQAGNLAWQAYSWARQDHLKTSLAGAFDSATDFGHFREGTGVDIRTLDALEDGGLGYNPANARQSPGLYDWFSGDAVGPVRDPDLDAFDSDAGTPLQAALPEFVDPKASPPLFEPRPPGWQTQRLPYANPLLKSNAPLNGAIAQVPTSGVEALETSIALAPYAMRRLFTVPLRFAGREQEVTLIEIATEQAAQTKVLLDQLASNPDLLYYEPIAARTKQIDRDPLYEQGSRGQWHLHRVGFTPAMLSDARSDSTSHVQRLTVAVIDSGIAWGHAELPAQTMWRNEGEIPENGIDDDGNGYIDDVVGWNFVNNNNLPWDLDGHGTMVAGVIAAQTNNGVGIAGLNPKVRTMALRVLDAHGEGSSARVSEAIAYAANNGARVINLSLGGRMLSRAESIAVRLAEAKGALVVAAAGNEGIELRDYGPATAPMVLAVGATDRNDKRIGASNWGAALDVVAPGVDVLSLRAIGTDLMTSFGAEFAGEHIVTQGGSDGYYRATGTSFAAPIVSGIASLRLMADPDLTPAELRRIVRNSATDLAEPGRDLETGYGMVNAGAVHDADPKHFVEAWIERVQVSQQGGKQAIEVIGTADSDLFRSATLSIAQAGQKMRFKEVAKLKNVVQDGRLGIVMAKQLDGASHWLLRLVVGSQDGREREARFKLAIE